MGHRGLGLPPRPERAVLVVRLEFDGRPGDVFLELRMHGPEILREEVFDLSLSVDDQGEGRALDPAHGEEVSAELLRRDRDETRQDGTPREVNRLAGLRGRPEREVAGHKGPGSNFDVPLCERGETSPTNTDLRSGLSDQRQGLDSN